VHGQQFSPDGRRDILRPPHERGCDAPIAIIATAARAQASKGDYLIASQDTTFYNYTGHKQMDGLGKLQSGILGILQHSVLLASEKGVPLGLIDNQLDIKTAVAFYGLRWRVEHLHFTMESGVGPPVRLNVDK